MNQELPSHPSASVDSVLPEAFPAVPTALHTFADEQLTADNTLREAPGASGLCSTAQLAPVARSTSVSTSPTLSSYQPTAVQRVAEEHEMPEKEVVTASEGVAG